jgi:hypothetical protein
MHTYQTFVLLFRIALNCSLVAADFFSTGSLYQGSTAQKAKKNFVISVRENVNQPVFSSSVSRPWLVHCYLEVLTQLCPPLSNSLPESCPASLSSSPRTQCFQIKCHLWCRCPRIPGVYFVSCSFYYISLTK